MIISTSDNKERLRVSFQLACRIFDILSGYSTDPPKHFKHLYYVNYLEDNSIGYLLSLDVEELENFLLDNIDLLTRNYARFRSHKTKLLHKRIINARIALRRAGIPIVQAVEFSLPEAK